MKSKRFKKIITSVGVLILLLCSLFTLSACSAYYHGDEEDYMIGYSEFYHDAFIGEYFWRGNFGENMEIVLPDEYNGFPVTRLGGYVGTGSPCPFRINFFEKSDLDEKLFGDARRSNTVCSLHSNTEEEVYADVKKQLEDDYGITEEFEIKDIVFKLRIGANLQKIEDVYGETFKYILIVKNEEGEVLTVYAFSFEVTVDEKNTTFYSDDSGRMYYTETNKLVEHFLYHNRDTIPERNLPATKV